MAHKKAAGKLTQRKTVRGKRLGLKVGNGQAIKSGGIILRQRGQTCLPGANVGMGRDFTLFAKKDGVIKFTNATRQKKRVEVV